MNERVARRNELGMSQAVAARGAGVSLATWRRWEEDPQSVRAATREACERVLLRSRENDDREVAAAHARFAAVWDKSSTLTPRQACAIALTLNLWVDSDINEWLRQPSEPLWEIQPFVELDRRVMFWVGENRAWIHTVAERCDAVAEALEAGDLPTDPSSPYIDQVLFAAALDHAEALLEESSELFADIPPRVVRDDDEETLHEDSDWTGIEEQLQFFTGTWAWAVPLRRDEDVRVPALLAARHPYTWMDGPIHESAL